MNQEKGAVSIIAFLILGVLLILGVYFLSFAIAESKIARSQEKGTATYYLAEAGVYKAIWKLKNDEEWKTCFVGSDLGYNCNCENWSATFVQPTGELIPDSAVTVSIQNSKCGEAQIVATSTIAFGERASQRVVKALVFKSYGSVTEDSAFFTDGPAENLSISSSNINIISGNIYSNGSIDIKGESIIELSDNPETEKLEGKILAVSDLSYKGGDLISEAKCARNECWPDEDICEYSIIGSGCPPPGETLATVDFDESLNSFKNRALTAQDFGQCHVFCQKSGQGPYQCSDQCVFSAKDFDDLLWEVGQDGNLFLDNPITYITGGVELKGGRRLTVIGSFAADGDIRIGGRYKWVEDEGMSQIRVVRPSETSPSGILSKGKIDIESYSYFPEDLDIEGVIFAYQAITIDKVLSPSIDIKGGVIGRKITINNTSQINIILDNDVILYGLGYIINGVVVVPHPEYSPVITIDHWEEAY